MASSAVGPSPQGLRERNKARTRQEIAAATLRLASERGLDHVTVEQIAAAADVAPRTFFRYFDSKEDALLADHSERLALLRETLRARPVDEGPLTAVRAAILEVVGDLEEQREPMLCKMELMQVNPGLRAHSLERMGDMERTLATALAERTGVDPERDLRPVPDGIAQCLQPAERGLFGIGLGKAPAHRPTLRRITMSYYLLGESMRVFYSSAHDRKRAASPIETARQPTRDCRSL